MLIELETEKKSQEVEEQIEVDQSEVEMREGYLNMHSISTQRMIQKLVLGFSKFKNKALQDVKMKYEKIMDDLDYVSVISKVNDKLQVVKELEASLEKKKQMLTEKRVEEGMSAEELREKYEHELISTRVKDLMERIVVQKQQLERLCNNKRTCRRRLTALRWVWLNTCARPGKTRGASSACPAWPTTEAWYSRRTRTTRMTSRAC